MHGFVHIKNRANVHYRTYNSEIPSVFVLQRLLPPIILIISVTNLLSHCLFVYDCPIWSRFMKKKQPFGSSVWNNNRRCEDKVRFTHVTKKYVDDSRNGMLTLDALSFELNSWICFFLVAFGDAFIIKQMVDRCLSNWLIEKCSAIRTD